MQLDTFLSSFKNASRQINVHEVRYLWDNALRGFLSQRKSL